MAENLNLRFAMRDVSCTSGKHLKARLTRRRDLNAGGSALSSSIGIQAGPIAGNHFHLRMQTEPARKIFPS